MQAPAGVERELAALVILVRLARAQDGARRARVDAVAAGAEANHASVAGAVRVVGVEQPRPGVVRGEGQPQQAPLAPGEDLRTQVEEGPRAHASTRDDADDARLLGNVEAARVAGPELDPGR